MVFVAENKPGYKSKVWGLGLVVLVLALVGIFWKADFKVAHAAHRLGKEARLIVHHASKNLCGQVSKGHARCMGQETLGASGQPLTGSPASSGSYGPVQFHTAYQLPCTPGGAVQSVCGTPSAYGPETIAIVDAGNFSTDVSGLDTSLQDYDNYYGIPACSDSDGCLSVINQSGASSPLPAEFSSGWSDEIALDVETAHMVCQNCKIVLVEANDDTVTNLSAAETEAVSLNPTSISNSWGGSDAGTYDSDFMHNGMAIVASTGDNGTVGNGQDWPADIPNVVAVSGTTLQINTDNTWAGETVWSGSGGGCSVKFGVPTWQSALSDWATNGCSNGGRAFGDVSMDADPSTGAAINMDGTWYEVGGTSLSSPLVAGIFALVGGVPSGGTASSLLYTLFDTSNSHDITSGNDCTSTITVQCTASAGFDTPSGLGSPNGVGGFASMYSPATNLASSDVTENQVKISWTASSSGSVSGYYLYRNGSQIADVSSTNYTDTGLTPNTAYDYYVVAHDSSGNLSGPSAAANVTTYYPEDINGDKHINLLDLSLLASEYGRSGAGIGRSDINSDGTVNLLDLSLLASEYGSE